jgi:hypothetical protein
MNESFNQSAVDGVSILIKILLSVFLLPHPVFLFRFHNEKIKKNKKNNNKIKMRERKRGSII